VLAIICGLFCGLISPALADPSEEFAAANKLFEKGDFDKAYSRYKQLLDDGQFNADLLYNLGNASFRLERPGEAALWYERALTLDPTHKESRQNLRFMKRTGGILQFEKENNLDQLLATVRSDTFLRGATLLGWLGLLGMVAAIVLRIGSGLRTALWIISPLLILLALSNFFCLYLKSQHRERIEDRAIVTAAGASAMTAPAHVASAIIELPPGSHLTKLSERGDWNYIELPGDLRGWVHDDAIDPLWPYDPALAD